MYYGVNFSGAEFGMSVDSKFDTSSKQIWFPEGHYNYFQSKGFNLIRLPLAWDLLQPNITFGFAAPYQAKLQEAVDFATKHKFTLIIDIHNYARKNGVQIGTSALPNTAFADLWSRLATLYKSYPNIIFGIMNEPHDMATSQWVASANAAISAIRAAGANNLILVPGNYWSGPTSWTNGEMSGIQDPANNYALDVHQYLSPTGNLSTSAVVSTTILKDRLSALVAWCKTNKKQFLLSETGTGPTDPKAKQAVQDGLTYLNNNADVFLGYSWWSCIGTAKPNDPFTPYAINPSLDYKTEDQKVAWLTALMATAPVQPTTPAVPQNIKKSEQTLQAPFDQGYTAYLKVPENTTIPAGSYPLGISTRTTYASSTMFVDSFILSNPSSSYDITWSSISLDLRGHTLQSFWDCTVTGTTGVVTITPTADSKTVLASGRNAFGLSITRQSDPTKASYQALITKVTF